MTGFLQDNRSQISGSLLQICLADQLTCPVYGNGCACLLSDIAITVNCPNENIKRLIRLNLRRCNHLQFPGITAGDFDDRLFINVVEQTAAGTVNHNPEDVLLFSECLHDKTHPFIFRSAIADQNLITWP